MKRSYVWHAFFVQQQIPSYDALRPVSQHSTKSVGPFCPVRRIIRAGNVRPSFSPVAMLSRVCLMHSSHGFWSAVITMPCNSIHIFIHIGIAKLIQHPPPKVIVVIQYPNLRVERSTLERGREITFHEVHLVFLPPQRGGHSSVLVCINLVLNRDGVNFHAFGGIPL